MHISQKMETAELVNLTLTLSYFESVFVPLQLSGKNLIADNIYSPPNSDIDSFLTKLFEVLTNIMQLDPSCPSIIMGGINIESLSLSAKIRFIEYITILTSFKYCPLIRSPTRVTDQSQTLIDRTRATHYFQVRNSGI